MNPLGKSGLEFMNDVIQKGAKIADNAIGSAIRGESVIGDATTDAINKSRGIFGTMKRMKGGPDFKAQDLSTAAKNAFSKDGMGNGVAWGQIAGSYIGASAGYRVLSGGGIHKDKNGNSNLIGVPFI